MKTIVEFVAQLNAKFPKDQPFKDSFVYTEGKRFYKVCRSRDGVKPNSVYAFIDKGNGDIYKAASWSQPANYVRGNINDEASIDDACGEYGIKYLK